MKDSNNRKNGEFLFEAMGEINDSFIFEAENYEKKKSSVALRKLIILAASLVTVLAITAALCIGFMVGSDEDGESTVPNLSPDSDIANGEVFAPNNKGESDTLKDDSQGGTVPSDTPSEEAPDKSPQNIPTLANTLESLKSSTTEFNTVFGREMLFDGKVKMIWKYSDEESYRVCEVAIASDAAKIRAVLEGNAEFEPINEPTLNYGIDGFWICFGDGLVYTPYLRATNGNIGYGELFAYGKELEPSSKVTEFVEELIEKEKTN